MKLFRRATTLMAMVLVAVPSARAPGRGDNDIPSRKDRAVTAELEKLSERWYRAWLEKDAATVERMMADDYVYVAPSGHARDRAAILRVVRAPGYRLQSWNRTDVVIRLLGDGAAVIRCRGQGEGDFEGKHFKDDHALLQAWSRVGGEWKVVLEQATARSPK